MPTETEIDEDDEPGNINEKLQSANDHIERADALREEAREDAAEFTKSNLDFDAAVTPRYNEETDSVMVDVVPKDVSPGLLETDDIQLVTPLEFSFGREMTDRDKIMNLKGVIANIEDRYDAGAPVDRVITEAASIGLSPDKAEDEVEKLRRKGEVYEPKQGHLRTT